jgi:hypothetical protein
MPKGANFHEGDRSEYLAEYILSTIGFCEPVSRPSDHFHTDIFVALAERKTVVQCEKKTYNELTANGLVVGMQVKSDTEPFDIKAKDGTDCHYLLRSSLPFYICIIDKDTQSIRIYTTLHRTHIEPSEDIKVITVEFGAENKAEGNTLTLNENKPICNYSLAELDASNANDKYSYRNKFYSVLTSWAFVEVTALTFQHHRLPWKIDVGDYKTNEAITIWNVLSQVTFMGTGDSKELKRTSVFVSIVLFLFKEYIAATHTHAALPTAIASAIDDLLKNLNDV